jgi:hypothetical protein
MIINSIVYPLQYKYCIVVILNSGIHAMLGYPDKPWPFPFPTKPGFMPRLNPESYDHAFHARDTKSMIIKLQTIKNPAGLGQG